MYATGKTAQIVTEMRKYQVSILGVSKIRWTDSGIMTLNSDKTVCYSGRTDGQHQEGVGIIMDKETKKCLLGWEPVGSRIIRARFFLRYVKTTIIQCYAPTEQTTDEDKDLFYNNLQDQLNKTPQHYILILMGDFNAKVGTENEGYETCMGRGGVGERNKNGQRFVDMCRKMGSS